MIKFVCLNTGTKYQDHDYVGKLHRGLRRNSTEPFVFECVVQSPYPGWWGKLMFFGRNERIVFLDLDIVITGNIDFLVAYDGPFCIWKDPWSGGYNSSVMSIGAGFGAEIKDRFVANAERIMSGMHGDQEWINSLYPPGSSFAREVDLWPAEKILSYKGDDCANDFRDASIVVFHGSPKPGDIREGWVGDAWV